MTDKGTEPAGSNKCYDLLSQRSYAAIHLRVPRSEHEWLNDMIREANLMASQQVLNVAQILGGAPESITLKASEVKE
jgi:hypothetical protein